MARKKGSKARIMVILAAVAAVLFFLVFSQDKPPAALPPSPEKFTVEKSGAGATVDYSATSVRLHGIVDAALLNAGYKAQGVQEQRREIPRQAIEGMIRWHTRNITLSTMETTTDRFRQSLQQALPTGVEVLAVQSDNWQGKRSIRADIGFRDVLAGDTVTIITDRIYLPLGPSPVPKPAGKERARLAIVIDDFGYSAEPITAFASIDRPLTYAVLPYRLHSNEAASKALAAGHQVMLHLPLEPLSSAEEQEKTSIKVTMTDEEIRRIVTQAIKEVPGIKGINNHQGSRATADKRVMKTVLSVVKNNNLFFIDSRTTAQSVAAATARELKIKTGENEVFLDNEDNVGAVKQQLRVAAKIALKEGESIAIGHARLNTARALREMLPELENEGIILVFASQLVK